MAYRGQEMMAQRGQEMTGNYGIAYTTPATGQTAMTVCQGQ